MAATMSMNVINAALVAKPLKATSTRRSTVTVRASQGLTTEPVVPPKKQSTLDYAKTLPGVTQPFPDVFDPANFLATASVKDVRRWRESELVHGRVSMLAALGFIVQEQLEDIPAFLNADGHVTGPAIGHFQQVEARGAVFWEPLLLAIGLAEAYRVGLGWETPTGDGFNALKDDYEPGNLGFDPLGLLPSDPAEKKIMQTKELNNGRLAMIAIAAFVAQELVEKTEIFEHLFTRFGAEIAAEDATLVKELSSIP